MNCKLKHFTEKTTRKCLKNQRVFFLGDSRARQLEIAFYSRLTSNLSFIDNKDPKDTLLNSEEINFVYPWMNKFFHTAHRALESELGTEESKWTWYVLGHVNLHSIRNYNSSKVYQSKFLDFFKSKTFPLLKNHAMENQNSKIIWLGEEIALDMRPANNSWRKAFQVINDEIRNLVNSLNLVNFVVMTTNTKTITSGGNWLASDRVHKEVKKKVSMLSLPGYLDTTYILNFLCPNVESMYCCIS